MFISDLYRVSALAGAIETKGSLSRFVNGFNRKMAYRKVCKHLDDITYYISNIEIEDFIYVMSMVSNEDTHGFDADGMTIHVKLISAMYKSIVFTFKDTGSKDIKYIKYEDTEISIAESHEKEYIQFNSSNMGEFDFNPRELIGVAVNGMMKNICKGLIFRGEE